MEIVIAHKHIQNIEQKLMHTKLEEHVRIQFWKIHHLHNMQCQFGNIMVAQFLNRIIKSIENVCLILIFERKKYINAKSQMKYI